MEQVKTPLRRASFWRRHRFALAFFFYVVIYNFLVVNRLKLWKVDNITYSYHLVDFSLGFATKLLPGAVFNALFGEHATKLAATIYSNVLMLLFFAGVAILLEKFCLQSEREQRNAAFFLVLFYLSGAYTFAVFTDELGMLDVYWLFLALVFFAVLGHKRLRYLIPLLYVACVMIHFSSLLNYIILFSIMLLYRISLEPEQKERRAYALIFAVSAAAAIGVSAFFVVKEKGFMCSYDDFHQIINSRGGDYFTYYDYAFYDIYKGERFIPDFVYDEPVFPWGIIHTIYYRIKFNFGLMKHIGSVIPFAFLVDFLVLLPVFVILVRFHMARVREKGDLLKRICSALLVIQFPFTIVFSLLFSVDVNRWMSHAVLVSFTSFLTILYFEEKTRADFLQRVDQWMRTLPAKIYVLAYATINFWAYF